MDLVVGKDIETGYLESKDFNHVFRILETVALRIKMKDAIVILSKDLIEAELQCFRLDNRQNKSMYKRNCLYTAVSFIHAVNNKLVLSERVPDLGKQAVEREILSF